jgi:hypothetical protein
MEATFKYKYYKYRIKYEKLLKEIDQRGGVYIPPTAGDADVNTLLTSNDCIICGERLSISPVIILHCNHGFHHHCLINWAMIRDQRCPLCRAPVTVGANGSVYDAGTRIVSGSGTFPSLITVNRAVPTTPPPRAIGTAPVATASASAGPSDMDTIHPLTPGLAGMDTIPSLTPGLAGMDTIPPLTPGLAGMDTPPNWPMGLPTPEATAGPSHGDAPPQGNPRPPSPVGRVRSEADRARIRLARDRMGAAGLLYDTDDDEWDTDPRMSTAHLRSNPLFPTAHLATDPAPAAGAAAPVTETDPAPAAGAAAPVTETDPYESSLAGASASYGSSLPPRSGWGPVPVPFHWSYPTYGIPRSGTEPAASVAGAAASEESEDALADQALLSNIFDTASRYR